MSYDPDDTIAAIATADGGAERGMVRVSGPRVAEIIGECFTVTAAERSESSDSVDAGDSIAPRPFAPRVFSGAVAVCVDRRAHSLPCDVLYWPGNRSYTRQPVAEFHTLGSPPLLRAVLAAVCRAGARFAEPGEFTLRAFLAGRIDLTQAEAVLGIIDAEGSGQLATAIEQLAGNLARPLHRLRDELLALLAELEAGLDFVEEDIEFITADQLTQRLRDAAREIHDVVEQMSSRLATSPAAHVVLAGPPNVGKSSLFNALAERFGASDQRGVSAIVSSERGTTRDYLTAALDFEGFRFELVDTAGVDFDSAPLSPIAASARNLAIEQGERALVRAICVDASTAVAEEDWTARTSPADVVVYTKVDLAPSPPNLLEQSVRAPVALTSSVTGEGLEALCREIIAQLSSMSAATRCHCVAATADRCRESARLAHAAVTRAADVAAMHGGEELIAAEIRVALGELGKVVGAVYTDDLLDRIFKTFCIGK